MSVLERALADNRVVVEFPRGGVEDWVAVAEVLLQEGLRAWAVGPDLLTILPEMLSLFGRRARIGVAGVVGPEDAAAAVAAGAHFVLAPVRVDGVAEACGDTPLVTGALTPQEVADRVAAGDQAVLVSPADALGTSYARWLPALFTDVALVAHGRLERYQCDMWLAAGARAVVVQDVVLRTEDGNGLNGIDEVGRRAASFAELVATAAN